MNCVLVLFVFAAISGFCIGEIKRPGYCYVQFPPTGEPKVIEVEKMNNLIAILRRESMKKFDDYKQEIESLKRQNLDEKIKHENCRSQIESLKDQNEDLMNQKQSLEEKMENINKIMIEDKNELSKLKTTIVELNQSVNDEKNGKSILIDENLELKQRIQECCGEIFDQDGTEDIFQASKKGSLNGLKFWHSKDPSSIHAKNGKYYNYTPLHYASRNGHFKIVEFLLSKGVDVDADDIYNVTPLMWASIKGHVPIVKALLDKGAKINYQDNDKWTPLHWAVDNNILPVVKLLIERGADRSLRDEYNRTPLDWAKKREFKTIEDYLSSL